MRILEMTASFGCLDRQTLRLDRGLNVLVLPNESGKSTWAAFLVAMFYGIDTSERAAKGRIPARLRYQPWSGAPMEGTVTLEREGRRLVIQRTSQKGKPMGGFRAYDPDTGMDIPELTGETCGRVLLGVEKEVFRRTAFLSGGELAVTVQEDLARRLSNLAASGDIGESYPAALQRLKGWKNRLQSGSRGLIPEAQARMARQQRLQADRTALEHREKELEARAHDLTEARISVPRERNALLGLILAPIYLVFAIIIATLGQWMPAVIAAVAFAGCLVGYYVNRKHNQKVTLLRQQAQKREEELRSVETELAVTRARLQDLPAMPEAGQEAELEELLFRENALEDAMAALTQAQETLAQGYGPRLTAAAGQLLQDLTLGRYDGAILDRELQLQLREAVTGLTRPLAALSKGTQDTAWLALRLAMTRLLLPEDVPVVVDDGFLTFDEARTAAALKLLKQEDRQVLVFSCRPMNVAN